MTRQIVLDTETTGIDIKQGNRLIEIGCVEVINRKITGNHYHQYINPERDIEEGAFKVHGLSQAFLRDKPLFAEVVEEFLDFVRGAELIIHNAPFDIGFLNHELSLLNRGHKPMADICSVTDTLVMAKEKHPGQRNSLDALCKRYAVDNSSRDLHGALLDSELLAEVYLLLTGGQTGLLLDMDTAGEVSAELKTVQDESIVLDAKPTKVIKASNNENDMHQDYLNFLETKSGKQALWGND